MVGHYSQLTGGTRRCGIIGGHFFSQKPVGKADHRSDRYHRRLPRADYSSPTSEASFRFPSALATGGEAMTALITGVKWIVLLAIVRSVGVYVEIYFQEATGSYISH